MEISLRQLRHLILDVIRALQQRGIGPGETVALVRLPRTSETLTAVVYAALSAWGVRVLFPMYLELEAMEAWLRVSGATALLMSPYEVESAGAQEADVAVTRWLRGVAERLGLPVHCFFQDLDLPSMLERRGERAHQASPGVEDPLVQELLGATGCGTECLLLTTSGTSGQGKLVRYTQGALLRSCASWEQAGFFHRERLGGRGFSLLLAHSMGIRTLWNAIWTRQPLCLITPEWFIDYPERVSELLLQMQPEHVTGGPATFHTLLELARVFPRLKDRCFRELKCLVSSGAPYDLALQRRIRSAFDLELHNAFGMTETMQVTSTLAGPTPEVGSGRLGSPLPGVQLRLGRDETLPPGRFRLSVCSPFGSSGYLEPGTRQPPAQAWFQTGNLVEQEGPGRGLRYVGREGQDFINDGLGVKISRRRLETLYRRDHDDHDHDELMQWIELFPLREEPGLAALVFLSPQAGQAEGQVVTDRTLLRRVQSFFESRLEQLRNELEAFELRHLAVARFAALVADPPGRARATWRGGRSSGAGASSSSGSPAATRSTPAWR